MAGCTLTGALSVSSFIKNAVTVIHAPFGCAHQVFSMLHAMINDSELTLAPQIIVSNLSDRDVIFGGEECLAKALDKAALKNPDLIILVTSCVPETIGDDCQAVVNEHPARQKIIYIPTSGFLGGCAKDGENACLIGLAKLAPHALPAEKTVALVGEKNLETEVEENYAEVKRLLDRLGVTVTTRFCRNSSVDDLKKISSVSCFILRDERCAAAGKFLSEKFDRPVVSEFPRGLAGCIDFLKSVGSACGISQNLIDEAVFDEEKYQALALAKFEKLRDKKIYLGAEPFDGTFEIAREAIKKLGMEESMDGAEIKLPFYLPVGVSGTVKMLNLWKRAIVYG
ncbi:MAG: nitrogenase component 1 [Methanocorpusculum sp.]|nr:nitrogenase component 1 [Methanocorpusculum sp.]